MTAAPFLLATGDRSPTKLSLAGSLKINDKLAVRAFAGPETGIDDTGGFDQTRRPE
jgi:hypothetical protein